MKAFLFFLFVTLMAGAANAEPYGNARFNFWIEVPKIFSVAEPEPENGDGRTFKTPDGKAELSASGHWIIQDDFAAEVSADKEFLKKDGWGFSYEPKVEKHTATYSGTKGDQIFYQRSITTCRNDAIVTYTLMYPRAQKGNFDSLIKGLNASFKEGIGPCAR